MKISFNVQDECLTDTAAPNAAADVSGQAYPGEAGHVRQQGDAQADARLTRGCAGTKSIEYREQGTTDWKPYTSRGRLHRREDVHDRVPRDRQQGQRVRGQDGRRSRSSRSTTTPPRRPRRPPTGNQDQRNYFIGSATLTLTATDDATGSGIDKIEYRVNGGAYTLYTTPVAFNTPGTYDVDYKATDKIGNVSTVKTISFRILSGAGCTSGTRSDEFDGTALGAQWQRHTRNGGSPLSAFTFSDGQLHMPTADFELDAANATTSVGPVNFIGQDLAALGTNWTAETEFTVKYTGGWQNTGLIIWNGDNNFVRSSITHSLSAGNIYVEQSKDNPTTTEGARSQAGSNITIAPEQGPGDHDPDALHARQRRPTPSQSQYRVMAPASMAMADWANFGGAAELRGPQPVGRRAP